MLTRYTPSGDENKKARVSQNKATDEDGRERKTMASTLQRYTTVWQHSLMRKSPQD